LYWRGGGGRSLFWGYISARSSKESGFDFVIGTNINAFVQGESGIQYLVGDLVVSVHEFMAQELRIYFGSLPNERYGLSFHWVCKGNPGFRRLPRPTCWGLGQSVNVFFHKPPGRVEYLNSLGLFLF